MTCEECKALRQPKEVPYAALEIVNDNLKKVWIALLVVIFLLVGTNLAWLCYCSQFEVVETSVEQDTDSGYNNYIGNDGDIFNGEAKDHNP